MALLVKINCTMNFLCYGTYSKNEDRKMGKLLRTLIIEDSEEDTQLLLRELRRVGYQVEFERVETDVAMRTMLSKKSWDLILSDYTLPKFGAPQALETLK